MVDRAFGLAAYISCATLMLAVVAVLVVAVRGALLSIYGCTWYMMPAPCNHDKPVGVSVCLLRAYYSSSM